MAISYKEKWQEANREIERLQARIEKLRRERGDELLTARIDRLRQHGDELAAALMNSRDAGGQIVDLAGIARHMRVDPRYTPQQWRQRGLLPPVDFPEIREPIWYAQTIKEKFAIPTGRMWYDTPADDQELSPAA